MSSIIKVLSEQVANQIAAGEVVNRPAAAVKELLENAIDARATEISLYIEDSGKTLVRVIDNGVGMSREDAQMAFMPHATSKINTADDLLHIDTMGFRGEALASIASVAQIELRTRRKQDELGVQIEINGGKIENIQQTTTPQGTSISMKNIYFNTPARRKFLSSDEAEYRYIEDVFTKTALAHPEIIFSLYKNSTRILHLSGGTLHSRVIQVFGTAFQQRLVRVNENLSDVSIDGYICKPDYTVKSRGKQYLFVNRRNIKHTGLNHAIENAFAGLIPEKSYPVYCIFIEVDPSTIDVNIHPAKTEIRFNNEKLIYSTLNAVVKHAIGVHQLSPSLDFDTFQLPLQPRYTSGSSGNYGSYGKNNLSKVSAEFREAYLKSINEIQKAEEELVEKDMESLQGELPLNEPQIDINTPITPAVPADNNIFQVAGSYIVFPLSSGLLIVDQQAASERILFDEFCEKEMLSVAQGDLAAQTLQEMLAAAKNTQDTQDEALNHLYGKMPSKMLLFPQSISLSASHTEVLKEMSSTLELFGWSFAWLGGNTFMLNAMPERSNEQEAQKIIEDILDLYIQKQINNESGNGAMSSKERLAAAMAKRTAVKHGEKLHKEEMLSMISRLFSSQNPHTSPSGQKTIRIIPPEEIRSMF